MKPHCADGGAAGLAALAEARKNNKPFDLVVLDCHMPDTDGFTTAEKIRLNPESLATKIVMLTSSGSPGNDALCEQLGIQAYLHKPAKSAELFSAICLVMEMRSAASERTPLVTSHVVRKARKSLRVLVAEDNLVNQRLASRMLEKMGDSVVLAKNGREAVNTLNQEAFDVILMDLQMPVLGGIEATAIIREQEKTTGIHIHIIALTAHAMKGDRERCLNAGMDGYLSKPIQSQKLYDLLDAVPQ
jgi:CheY-like chemotaxis protein